jgi:hypothetical protein
MINKDNLYDWVFHYNHISKTWAAVKRDEIADYFNGKAKDVLTSKKHSTLVDIITKTSGDSDKLRKLVNG